MNGFLNLYKPAGITSMEAVRRVKRLAGHRQKVGHCGTLDPMARGVLPICFGQATRLMEYVVGGRKRYAMEVELGVTTGTYDAEGEVVKTGDVTGLTPEMVERVAQSFVGSIKQRPPMYSAVKVDGQRLYKLARAGIEVEREARPVEIFAIRIVESPLPKVVLEIESGPGVYMRSLAHDMGEVLGCGGHVSALERSYCGGFEVTDAVTLETLEEASSEPGGLEKFLFPADWILRDHKSTSMDQAAEKHLNNGQPVALRTPLLDAGYLEEFRAYSADGRFLALVRFDRAASAWKPVKVFHLESPSPYAPAISSV
ncbi:MAG: tRNA pseudouridine(55) synthase TruB [SAR202 cluster bacterium Io17-Chloro-G2]|nr:MAG: tRNA pseudouridine(55) synthase TruB [SAR202 cluster bacterium Io17-Chloro-G2]